MPAKSKSSSRTSTERKPWVDPDDAPEWTEEMVARAEISEGDRIIRRGRPPLAADLPQQKLYDNQDLC